MADHSYFPTNPNQASFANSGIALLRSATLIDAARKNLAQMVDTRLPILMVSTTDAAELLLNVNSDRVLLVELDDPRDQQPDSALQWLRGQHKAHQQLKSVAMSKHCDADTVVTALCAGTSGYLVNDPSISAAQQVEDLLRGFKQLADGKPPVSDAVLPHLVRAVRATQYPPTRTSTTHSGNRESLTAPAQNSLLSKRETEVLMLAGKGFTYAEMAALLDLSVHTISTHTRRIYAKLEVNSRSAAIYEATRQGLLLERSAA